MATKLDMDLLKNRKAAINHNIKNDNKPTITANAIDTETNTALRIKNKRQINYYIFLDDYFRFKDIAYTQRLTVSELFNAIISGVKENISNDTLEMAKAFTTLKDMLEKEKQCIRQSLLVNLSDYNDFVELRDKHNLEFFEVFNLGLNVYQDKYLNNVKLIPNPRRKDLSDFTSADLHSIQKQKRKIKIQNAQNKPLF
jgi:hypothetical protein|nr:MAG TPA: hypothetical protein [Caudoviricetes sp.]